MAKEIYKVTADVACIIEKNEKGEVTRIAGVTRPQLLKEKVNIVNRTTKDNAEVDALLSVLDAE